MILTAEFLTGYSNVNNWKDEKSYMEVTAGQEESVYFRLVDQALSGRRYCPAVGATLMVTIPALDASQSITRSAVAAAPGQDTSLWRLPILDTDLPTSGTRSLLLILYEGATIRRGLAHQALRIKAFDTSC